jgi:non-haem Fe2+, alpha-ketoglutarate-dependent halogenase
MNSYEQRGYLFPLRVLTDAEAAHFRAQFIEYRAGVDERLKTLPARDQYKVFSETHIFLPWVYEMITHPNVLDAVESVLGPNLLIWNTRWFAKMAGDKTYISWHQDATYWGLRPPNVATAWIALSDSCPENGCMRVIPESHRGPLLPQVETFAADNALSRGQEIAVEVNESDAVDIVLRPGEMSLHHIGIVHGSNANRSDRARIGIAVRFITPDVVQEGSQRQIALLARGIDSYGHFELVGPPTQEGISARHELHSIAIGRMMKNLMPEDFEEAL